MSYRIFLSAPDVGATERDLLLEAFDSNWLSGMGPQVDALERELATLSGRTEAVALTSGTAALHLALHALGIGPGDRVVTSTMTFAATANAIRYVGAKPVFVDVDPASWQIDPELLEAELTESAEAGVPASAILTVDLYGQCCDYDRIGAVARDRGVPIVEDAAEAVGATWRGWPAGSFGAVGVYSFNGNKIITGGGGGALLTDDADLASRVRYLSTQARQPAAHYEHTEVGYNYRLSSLLAAVVRGQLRHLDEKVDRRREVNRLYQALLGELPGVDFMPFVEHGAPNAWLTCLTIDPREAGTDRDTVTRHLLDCGIEARPVWKPMHLQPVFADAPVRERGVAARLFDTGLCLPSGSSLTDADVGEVADEVRSCF